MRYYIIAGETSGDLHGSNLMKAIRELDADAVFRCWGGDRMEAEGGVLVRHIRDLDYMGFVEVLRNIRRIMGHFKLCKKDLLAWKPDVLVLIDYPGFNLRMARFAKRQGIRVVYYISPQIWAWKQSRVRQIRKYVDKMLVILPFEKDFYERFGVNVDYTGHPLLDALQHGDELNEAATFRKRHAIPDKPLVAILPGSRQQEIKRMLQVMVEASKDFPSHHFVVAGLSKYPREFYEQSVDGSGVTIVFDQTYQLLRHAEVAMVTSGTATLETALLDVPQVVCYKTSALTYLAARYVVKVPYISLVNLIMQKQVIKELIQHQCTSSTISEELNKILGDASYRQQVLDDYRELRLRLGDGGASAIAAKEVTMRRRGEGATR